jgi:hypothetical protein
MSNPNPNNFSNPNQSFHNTANNPGDINQSQHNQSYLSHDSSAGNNSNRIAGQQMQQPEPNSISNVELQDHNINNQNQNQNLNNPNINNQNLNNQNL